MTSGELIRAARLRAGLSQGELAERLGLPQSSIARWEVDTVEPGLSTLRRVLQACGYDLSLAWSRSSATRNATRASSRCSSSRRRSGCATCSCGSKSE